MRKIVHASILIVKGMESAVNVLLITGKGG